MLELLLLDEELELFELDELLELELLELEDELELLELDEELELELLELELLLLDLLELLELEEEELEEMQSSARIRQGPCEYDDELELLDDGISRESPQLLRLFPAACSKACNCSYLARPSLLSVFSLVLKSM